MTHRDSVLRRLVEVNPAPEDVELPPVSDVALLESVLERAHSEELWFRPVRMRSWRPGLVVAATAFVVVLVVAGVLGLLTGVFAEQEGPVVTEPPTVPRYEATISALDDGLFSASGSAVGAGVMCSEGTIDTITISKQAATSRGGEYSDPYSATEEHTLTCADGSGTIVVGMWVYQSHLTTGYIRFGEWVVVSGTDDYERLAGGGEFDGGCDPDGANCSFEYTGRLDLSRDLGTATTTAPPAGRFDIEITYEGRFTADPFTAAGAAVDAGLFCPEGMIARICAGTEYGQSVDPCEDTFFCTDGTGRMTLATDMRRPAVGAQTIDTRYTGKWTVIGGSNAYESVTGSGRLSGLDEGDTHRTTWLWTGYFEVSE